MLIKAKGDTMYRLFFYLCLIKLNKMEVKVSMVIMSHLSDLQVDRSDKNIWKLNFVKYLVSKYPDTSVEIDPDAVYKEYVENFWNGGSSL